MHRPTSILIVDSDIGFATMLKEQLEQDDDYRATIAQAGHEALAIASRETFDLAIVDLGIDPADGLDGEAVARRLRQQQSQLRLMLMPLAGSVLPEALGDLDVQGLLPKPFFLPDLPNLLEAALTIPFGESERPLDAFTKRREDVRPPVAVSPPQPPQERSKRIASELRTLAQDVNATAVLVSRRAQVLGSLGTLDPEDLDALALVVGQGCELSERTAQALGRRQQRFELSLAGDDYVLYSVTVVGDVLLSVVLQSHIEVDVLRRRAKATLEHLHELMAGS